MADADIRGLRASLYKWPDFQEQGATASLLLIELLPGALRTHRKDSDEPEFGAAVLADMAEAAAAVNAPELLAELLDRNGSRLSFLCIVVGEATPLVLDEAAAWARAGRAAGAAFIVTSVMATPTAEAAQSLREACDTLLFTADPAALLHASRLLLEHRRLIGYDAADMMPIWRGRVGWIERSTETESALSAVLDRARAHFGMAAPAAVSLLFTVTDGGPTLTERDVLVTGMASLAGGADLLVAANKPIWEQEQAAVEVSVLFGAE